MHETGKVEELDITGYVFVIHSGGERDDQGRVIAKPFLLYIENQPHVPVFSDMDRAVQTIQETRLEDQTVAVDFMQVDTPADFIASMPYPVIADPERTDEGKIRFKKLSC